MSLLESMGSIGKQFTRMQVVDQLNEMKTENEVKNDIKRQFFIDLKNPKRLVAVLEKITKKRKIIKRIIDN